VNIWRICLQDADPKTPSANGRQRWNSPGMPIVYAAQDAGLAVLEMLAHLDVPELRKQYSLIPISLEDSLVQEVDVSALPKNWRADPPPCELREVGDDWARKANCPVLRVPSALVPEQYNLLMNTEHPEFIQLGFGEPVPFRFDASLVKTEPRR
jgi:RES domain-containing protein